MNAHEAARESQGSRLLLTLALTATVASGPAIAGQGPAGPYPPECLASAPTGPGLGQAEIDALLAAPDLDSRLDDVFRFEHDVRMDSWRTIRIHETFTLRAFLAADRRGVLFLNGPAFTGHNYAIPVPGYDAPRIFAERGWIAYTADYLGAGCSTRPKHGDSANFENNITAMEAVSEYVRELRDIPRLDLYGEGVGGAIATQLAADPTTVRTVTMVGMLYKTIPPQAFTTSHEFLHMLHQDKDGYVFFPPEIYFLFFGLAAPEALDFILRTQPGVYPVGIFYVGSEPPPYFDPGVARVPGLVLFGRLDFLATPNDPFDLVHDYGVGGAELVVFENAGHIPRNETPESAAAHWAAMLEFVGRN